MVAYLSESPKSVALELVLFGGTSPLGNWKDAAAYGMVPVKMWQGSSQVVLSYVDRHTIYIYRQI